LIIKLAFPSAYERKPSISKRARLLSVAQSVKQRDFPVVP
jgi:hypothetical protein